MPKITVRKCPFTKTIFETRAAYRKHLLKLRKSRNASRRVRLDRRLAREEIMTALNKVRTIAELVAVIPEQYTNMIVAEYGSDLGKIDIAKQVRMVHFELTTMRYSDKTSNTHACPRSGKTNWGGRKDDVPRGYPGFSGNTKYALMVPEGFDGWFADFSRTLSHYGIYTGTGGGRGKSPEGAQQYYYDVKVFLDDFPGIAAHVAEVHEVYKKLVFTKKLRDERIHDPVYTSVIGETA